MSILGYTRCQYRTGQQFHGNPKGQTQGDYMTKWTLLWIAATFMAGIAWGQAVSRFLRHHQLLAGQRGVQPGVYIPGTCAAGQYGLAVASPGSNTANVNARRVLALGELVQNFFGRGSK